MDRVLRINGNDQRIACGDPDMTPKPGSKKPAGEKPSKLDRLLR